MKIKSTVLASETRSKQVIASLHHSFTQYLIIEGAAAPLALNNFLIGAVPGRKCYETTLTMIGGEKSNAPFKKFRAFLGGHEVLIQFNFHQQIFIYSLDEYVLSGSFEHCAV